MQAIAATLQSLEAQADLLTGVNRQMYGNIEEKDAVTNVKVGIERSSLMVKDYFELLRISRERIFSRMIQQGQVLYRKGKRGAYILGSSQITFDVQSKYYIHSDYGINVSMDGEDAAKVDRVQMIAKELAGAGVIEPQVLMKIVTHDNIVDMMDELEESIYKQKKENSKLAQLEGQVEETMKQLDEAQKQLDKITKDNERFQKKHYELEERKVAAIEFKAEDESKDNSITRYNEGLKTRKELDLKRRIVELEEAELKLAALQGQREGINLGNRKEVNQGAVGL